MSGETATGWRVVGGSVRGAAHVRKRLPNQDAWGAWHNVGDTPIALGVVADGHGSARCVRSAAGARIAVEVSHQVISGLANELLCGPSILPDIPKLLVDQWRKMVADHLLEQPLAESDLPETISLETRRELALNPVEAYGTTLLVCAAATDRVVTIQVGDGDVLAVGADGRCSQCVETDLETVGNETHSMCELDPSTFRVGVLELPPEQSTGHATDTIVLMSTDGVSNAFRSDDDFHQLATDLHADVHRRTLDQVAGDLPGWLADFSTLGSGDDVTLCLMVRPGSAREPGTLRRSQMIDLPPTVLSRSEAQSTRASDSSGIVPLMQRAITCLSHGSEDHE